jgi:hypothetical protein
MLRNSWISTGGRITGAILPHLGEYLCLERLAEFIRVNLVGIISGAADLFQLVGAGNNNFFYPGFE